MGQGSRIKISSSSASRIEAGLIYRQLLLCRRTTIGLGGQTTIAVALTFYRFAHALWWLFLTIA